MRLTNKNLMTFLIQSTAHDSLFEDNETQIKYIHYTDKLHRVFE